MLVGAVAVSAKHMEVVVRNGSTTGGNCDPTACIDRENHRGGEMGLTYSVDNIELVYYIANEQENAKIWSW
jgi:hypothetical protein